MKCPFCSEIIQDGAIKCKFCKEFIVSNQNSELTNKNLSNYNNEANTIPEKDSKKQLTNFNSIINNCPNCLSENINSIICSNCLENIYSNIIKNNIKSDYELNLIFGNLENAHKYEKNNELKLALTAYNFVKKRIEIEEIQKIIEIKIEMINDKLGISNTIDTIENTDNKISEFIEVCEKKRKNDKKYDGTLTKIGGWLNLFIKCCFISVLLIIKDIMINFSSIINLFEEETNNKIIFCISIGFSIIEGILFLLSGILLSSRNKRGVLIAKIVLILAIIEVIFSSMVFPPMDSTDAATILVCIIWLLYLFKSKRIYTIFYYEEYKK